MINDKTYLVNICDSAPPTPLLRCAVFFILLLFSQRGAFKKRFEGQIVIKLKWAPYKFISIFPSRPNPGDRLSMRLFVNSYLIYIVREVYVDG